MEGYCSSSDKTVHSAGTHVAASHLMRTDKFMDMRGHARRHVYGRVCTQAHVLGTATAATTPCVVPAHTAETHPPQSPTASSQISPPSPRASRAGHPARRRCRHRRHRSCRAPHRPRVAPTPRQVPTPRRRQCPRLRRRYSGTIKVYTRA